MKIKVVQLAGNQDISVIIVNWNRRQLLARCLASLMRQREANLEIIVVDNGSSDGSLEMVESEFGRGQPFPVRLIANSYNRGFCAANNQGIALARHPWVALINNDAEADPDWAASLLEAAQSRPDVGMVASKILVYDEPGRIDKVGHLVYFDGQNRGRGSGEFDHGQYDQLEEVAWPDGCAAAYRKAMLEEIGGFDEDFFAYADDAELGLRARLAGWRALYTPRAVVRHHRGATLGLRSFQRLVLIERNRVLLAAKLFPWILLFFNPLFYAARLLAGAWAAILGKGEIGRYPSWKDKLAAAAALLQGDLKALPLLPRMLAKRRQLRSIRRIGTWQTLQLLWRYRISLRKLSQQAI
ncbi:MAG: glycosyltransferase family 2 protein [Bryobacteraceae bacterium]|nr:glycosyltransferase family 2 protein [Bryobacteraceae bacterium]MDW8378317.1 glycosyltransferase family 2 protein [Bryobacterales bacterium]